jgi:4-hydroxy-2-oxoheptanedioate aldolase
MKGLVKGRPTKSSHKTPAVIVNVPVNGTDENTVRANAWMFQRYRDRRARHPALSR